MSTMLGRKAAWGERTCGCCEVGPDKRGWKRVENRQWRAEVSAELQDPPAAATKRAVAAQDRQSGTRTPPSGPSANGGDE